MPSPAHFDVTAFFTSIAKAADSSSPFTGFWTIPELCLGFEASFWWWPTSDNCCLLPFGLVFFFFLLFQFSYFTFETIMRAIALFTELNWVWLTVGERGVNWGGVGVVLFRLFSVCSLWWTMKWVLVQPFHIIWEIIQFSVTVILKSEKNVFIKKIKTL